MQPDGARILYIDDDAGLARLAARVLTRQGFAVTTANSGAEGLEKAAAERFDLVAVDHYMPGMDGLETLARLRERSDAPPVVYVTGSEEGRVAVAALKAGAADYVVKTVGEDFFDLLSSAFRHVLDRSRLEREKIAAEEQLRAGNERLAALLREVNHRVANSLQMVSAMVRLQASATSDPGARDALEDTQSRIAAIAQVHRRLYTSDDVQQIDMREYLAAMIEELGDTWSTPAAPRTLTLTAQPILLATDRAVSLGVIVNELVSNACKYAYPAGGPGEVRVALDADGAQFTLAVEDDGCGIDLSAKPRGTGVGTKLIRAMAHSLQSAVEYDTRDRGTRATLTAALI